MRRAAVLALAVSVTAAACAAAGPVRAQDYGAQPADSYLGELDVRLFFTVARPDLYGARVVLHDENGVMQNSAWTGSIPEGNLQRALGGGLEVSYGPYADVKFLAALEGSGSSAQGSFTGTGPRTFTDPVAGRLAQRMDRLSRYPVFGQFVGATVLMRSFDWCRFGLSLRAGACELAGAVERGSESGPFGQSWWRAQLSGTAPAAFVGLEWEWLATANALGIPLAGYASIGYRMVQFSTVGLSYADSDGFRRTGDWTNADGTHRVLDLSGAEVRIGVQIPINLAPAY